MNYDCVAVRSHFTGTLLCLRQHRSTTASAHISVLVRWIIVPLSSYRGKYVTSYRYHDRINEIHGIYSSCGTCGIPLRSDPLHVSTVLVSSMSITNQLLVSIIPVWISRTPNFSTIQQQHHTNCCNTRGKHTTRYRIRSIIVMQDNNRAELPGRFSAFALSPLSNQLGIRTRWCRVVY